MTETKTKIHIESVQGFKILCLAKKTHRCFDRTTERERDFLFTYVNERGKGQETFFVKQDIAESVLNESLELPKQYKVSINFK